MVLLLDGGDRREVRLSRLLVAGNVSAQPHGEPMAVGMAHAEALIEMRFAVAQMAIDDGAEIVVGMERLRDGAEGHGLVDRHPAKRPVHRRRPMDVSARQIPSPHGASRQSFGEVTGSNIVLFARLGRGEIPDAAAKERKHETGADEESDFEACVAPPAGKGRMHGLDEGDLRVLVRQVAHRDEGVSAVGEGHAQDPGVGAEGGERLLRSEDGEQARGLGGHQRRPRLDVAVVVGEKRGALILGRALGQACGKRALPIAVRLQRLVLETHRGQVGHQRQTLFGERECRLPRLKGLGDEADGGKRSEDGNENRNRAP